MHPSATRSTTQAASNIARWKHRCHDASARPYHRHVRYPRARPVLGPKGVRDAGDVESPSGYRGAAGEPQSPGESDRCRPSCHFFWKVIWQTERSGTWAKEWLQMFFCRFFDNDSPENSASWLQYAAVLCIFSKQRLNILKIELPINQRAKPLNNGICFSFLGPQHRNEELKKRLCGIECEPPPGLKHLTFVDFLDFFLLRSWFLWLSEKIPTPNILRTNLDLDGCDPRYPG